MKRLLLIALTLISAQHTLAQSSEEERKNARPFKIASWGEWNNNDFFIPSPERESKEMIQLEVTNMGYSRDYFIKKDSPFNLYHKTGNEKEPYAIALAISIPAGVKKPLVLLFQGEDDKAQYKIYDIDPSIFPYGTYQIVNTTPIPLKIQFGKKQQDLRPGALASIQLDDSERDNAIHCKIGIIQDNQLKLVWENMLLNRSKKRMLMFIHPVKDEAGRPAVRCKSLVDFKIAKKEN